MFAAIILAIVLFAQDAKSDCISNYPVMKNEKHVCKIGLKDLSGIKSEITVTFKHCKSPYQANIYKRTTSTSSSEVKELKHNFTPHRTTYEQTVDGKTYALIVNFNETGNGMITITIMVQNAGKEKRKILSGTFLASKDDCSWYDKLSHSEEVGFITGMVAIGAVLFTILAVLIGRILRKRYPGTNYLFSPYSDREPQQSKDTTFIEERTQGTSRAALLNEQVEK